METWIADCGKANTGDFVCVMVRKCREFSLRDDGNAKVALSDGGRQYCSRFCDRGKKKTRRLASDRRTSRLFERKEFVSSDELVLLRRSIVSRVSRRVNLVLRQYSTVKKNHSLVREVNSKRR